MASNDLLIKCSHTYIETILPVQMRRIIYEHALDNMEELAVDPKFSDAERTAFSEAVVTFKKLMLQTKTVMKTGAGVQSSKIAVGRGAVFAQDDGAEPETMKAAANYIRYGVRPALRIAPHFIVWASLFAMLSWCASPPIFYVIVVRLASQRRGLDVIPNGIIALFERYAPESRLGRVLREAWMSSLLFGELVLLQRYMQLGSTIQPEKWSWFVNLWGLPDETVEVAYGLTVPFGVTPREFVTQSLRGINLLSSMQSFGAVNATLVIPTMHPDVIRTVEETGEVLERQYAYIHNPAVRKLQQNVSHAAFALAIPIILSGAMLASERYVGAKARTIVRNLRLVLIALQVGVSVTQTIQLLRPSFTNYNILELTNFSQDKRQCGKPGVVKATTKCGNCQRFGHNKRTCRYAARKAKRPMNKQ